MSNSKEIVLSVEETEEMNELGLNKNQYLLACKHIKGMVVSDAGPGTGKTHTIVERYKHMIFKDGIDPNDILMITFTNNGAKEMSDRIKKAIYEEADKESDTDKKNKIKSMVKNVKTSTFDSLCYKIVLCSPDKLTDIFEIKETLSRNASLIENDTLNKQFFKKYYLETISEPEFAKKYASLGGSPVAAIKDKIYDVYSLISKLMCRGIIPMRKGWFKNGKSLLIGDCDFMERKVSVSKDVYKNIGKISDEDVVLSEFAKYTGPEAIKEASYEDRSLLIDFIHDIYYGFVRRSISENRLTFGLNAMFAYMLLYHDEGIRNLNKVKYLTVDEFQDTNELQMRISLLLLWEDNLCVVGDWKQSIYKFRYAEEKNITHFDRRIERLIDDLNFDDIRVPTIGKKIAHVDLDQNYRSSRLILDKAFESLTIKGTKDDSYIINGNIINLRSMRNQAIGSYTGFELYSANNRQTEVEMTVSKIIDYKTNDKYRIVEKDGSVRNVKFKDIAVLVRNYAFARDVLEECKARNVPAFYQGDLQIMSSREGKLTLAWLRYINNPADKRGLVTILADLGYSLQQIKFILSDREANTPLDIKDKLQRASKMKRRPNRLLTEIYSFYSDLDYDIIQSITNILSSAYSGSLVTISDLINVIEDDINSGTKFDIEQSLDTEAVTIQTMHKSKGLEYPIVIIPNINTSNFPNVKEDGDVVVFDDDYGVRLKKQYYSNVIDGKEQASLFDSWRWKILKLGCPKDYNQERRLYFVALSRSKQYVTLLSHKASNFFTHYSESGKVGTILDLDNTKYQETADSEKIDAPVFGEYEKRKKGVSVHDVMNTYANVAEESVTAPDDNRKGKGKEYGEKVHNQAYLMGRGIKPTEEFEDLKNVKTVLDGLKGSKLSLEHKCTYPITKEITIRGVIDVLAEFPDRVEIHDYKTDTDDRYVKEYELQLSIYAHCVEEALHDGRKVLCFIDFVSPDYYVPEKRFHPVEIMSKDEIKRLVQDKNI